LTLLALNANAATADPLKNAMDAATATDAPLVAADFENIRAALSVRNAERKSARQSIGVSRIPIDPMVIEMLASESQQKRTDGRVAIHVQANDAAALTLMKTMAGIGEVGSILPLTESAIIYVNTEELQKLRNMPQILEIKAHRPELMGTHHGARLTEGDRLHRALETRTKFNTGGEGVSVCVISDGIANASAAKLTGDLPMNIETCSNEPLTGQPDKGDEGTAMLEIVHDLAPQARLSFCGALGNRSFGEAMLWSAIKANNGNGCDVIVDDVYNLGEPRYQISTETDLINTIVREIGTTVVTAAGNLANEVHSATFYDARFSAGSAASGFHDFGAAIGKPSATSLQAGILPGGRLTLVLQWNEAAGKASSDLAMAVTTLDNKPLTKTTDSIKVIEISDFVQNGKGNPYEVVTLENTSKVTQVVRVLLQRKTGTERLDVSIARLASSSSGIDPRYVTPFKSIFGHSGAEEAISVAAVNASDPGLDTIESFSSRGYVRTEFNAQGERDDTYVLKPDITAVDGVAITGAGGFGDGPAGNKRFSGTSASAPHVAGVAALLLSKYPNTDVKKVLQYSSDRRGDPQTWGQGLLNAERAMHLANSYSLTQPKSALTQRGKADLLLDQVKSAQRARIAEQTQREAIILQNE
jgi:hypothetical protein